jgi:hypothetical protein
MLAGWQPTQKTLSNRRYRAKNPDRAAAHDAVRYALAAGRLARTFECADCGADGPTHFDHYRGYYEKYRLTVREVCPQCHAKSEQARRTARGGRIASHA